MESARFNNVTPVSSEIMFNRLMFLDGLEQPLKGNVKMKNRYVFSGIPAVIRVLADAVFFFAFVYMLYDSPSTGRFVLVFAADCVLTFLFDKAICLWLSVMFGGRLDRVRKQGTLISFQNGRPVMRKYLNPIEKNRILVELAKTADNSQLDKSTLHAGFSDDAVSYYTGDESRTVTVEYAKIKAIYETDDYFVFVGKGADITLEKGGFEPGTAEAFSTFISQKLGERYSAQEFIRLIYNY